MTHRIIAFVLLLGLTAAAAGCTAAVGTTGSLPPPEAKTFFAQTFSSAGDVDDRIPETIAERETAATPERVEPENAEPEIPTEKTDVSMPNAPVSPHDTATDEAKTSESATESGVSETANAVETAEADKPAETQKPQGLQSDRNVEPSETPPPATTQPPLPDTPFVPETTDKPPPAPTQAPDKPSPTPETESLATTQPPETQPPQPSRPPEPENPVPDAERMARMFLELLNAERAKMGARPLVTGDRLRQMAQVRADELTVLFDHDRPNGEPSRTIYTEFEYGNRYDYTDLGFGTVYYPAHYGEDIGQTALSEGGGIEEAIRSMTEGFRGSSEHWSDLMNPVYGAAGVAVSVERIDMGEGFPALYRCNFEVLLVDRLYE